MRSYVNFSASMSRPLISATLLDHRLVTWLKNYNIDRALRYEQTKDLLWGTHCQFWSDICIFFEQGVSQSMQDQFLFFFWIIDLGPWDLHTASAIERGLKCRSTPTSDLRARLIKVRDIPDFDIWTSLPCVGFGSGKKWDDGRTWSHLYDVSSARYREMAIISFTRILRSMISSTISRLVHFFTNILMLSLSELVSHEMMSRQTYMQRRAWKKSSHQWVFWMLWRRNPKGRSISWESSAVKLRSLD